jgi:hypothetical protein
VVYPLLTGKTAGEQARRPKAIYKRGETWNHFTTGPLYELPLHAVERSLDPRLLNWLGRGFARPSDPGGFQSLAEAAASLQDWRKREWIAKPGRRQASALEARALQLELELQRVIEDTDRMVVSQDPMLDGQIERSKIGLHRFNNARPHVLTFPDDAGPSTRSN